jgi:multisubunit Na+/H+ antiporter MnhF subunit
VSAWLLAAIALLLGFIPCGYVVVRSGRMDRLVALQLAGILAELVLVLLAETDGRSSYYDIALMLALLTFPATLAFTHTLERWL